MQKEYIDVDYTMMSEDENADDKNTDIIINTDPASAAISGIVGVVNNVTNAIKEYNMCKQQEITKRAAIKAQMKVEIEKINSQKEMYLKFLDNNHKENMKQIESFHTQTMAGLENIRIAIDTASKNSDMDCMLELIKAQTFFMEMNNKSQLALMEQVNKPLVEINQTNKPFGYLE